LGREKKKDEQIKSATNNSYKKYKRGRKGGKTKNEA